MSTPPAENQPEQPVEQPVKPPPPTAPIRPEMSEVEIRAAGLAVDVPYESGDPNPKRLRYADLGPEKKWVPPPGWAEDTTPTPATTTDTIDGGEQTPPDEKIGGTGSSA